MVSKFDGTKVKLGYRSQIRVRMSSEVNATFIMVYQETRGFIGVYLKGMAENGGFEPPIELSPYNGLANRRLQPLGQLSVLLADTAFCFG
jgi:hypothetical protein